MPPYLTALRCLFVVAKHNGVQISPERLLGITGDNIVGTMLRLMHDVGLTGKFLKNLDWDKFEALGSAFPVMVEGKDGNWAIVLGIVSPGSDQATAAIMDPRAEEADTNLMPRAEFEATWAGNVMLCKRKYRLAEERQAFGLRWFITEVLRQKQHLRDVAILEAISANIALMVPLFFNILIDKVIPHHSYNTLFALALIFLTVALFEGIFSYAKQCLILFIGNKIDARLNSKTFEHMLHLPVHFFEGCPAGALIRHMQQTEGIRAFLVGRLFQTLLDLALLPILLVCLLFYSVKLTAVVILFSLVIAAIIGMMIPLYRRKLDMLYQAEGARQADLVETIHGMRTVKSLTLEPQRQDSWDSKIVNAIRCRTSVFYVNTIGVTITNVMDRLVTLSVLSLGVVEVFDGALTIGSLVGFSMLSARVTQPLIAVVGLINEYQQTALSVEMLGNLMNHPPEREAGHHGIMPPITGQTEFDDVMFSYEGSVSPALDRVSFTVEEGQMIGVVGRSGSGKTTVTRLIQGIHVPQGGLIRLNGNDIRHIDLAHLRRHIGVVLQDSFLFRGTIRDNIAATQPDAPLEEIMRAARQAGAEEFIDRLPRSYDTLVEEGASNFSGGQRQRIAIARALLSGPRLLIFDEATSALDPDSEAIIQQNLSDIARGRTMIVVSHRLSSLVSADAILVLEHGVKLDFAPHSVLLERCETYRHLWQQQNRHLQ